MDTYSLAWVVCLLVTGLAFPLLLDGLRRVVRARVQRRVGPPVTQTFYDIAKLFRVPPILPPESPVFWWVPYAVFSVSALLTLMIPIPGVPGLAGSYGMISFVYVLGLATTLTCLGGLVVRNPYSNAGSVRELVIVSVFELFVAASVVGWWVKVGGLRLSALSDAMGSPAVYLRPSTIFLGLSLFVIAYVEGGYVPFDIAEAETEVMGGPLLEYSGRFYALMLWGSLMKRYALLGLATSVVLVAPIAGALAEYVGSQWAAVISYASFLVLAALIKAFFSVIEALNPRLRLDAAVKPLAALSLIPVTGLLLGWFGW